MKTFALSLGFFVVAILLTGLLYGAIDAPANEVFSAEHVRVDHVLPEDGRLDWAAHGESEEDA